MIKINLSLIGVLFCLFIVGTSNVSAQDITVLTVNEHKPVVSAVIGCRLAGANKDSILYTNENGIASFPTTFNGFPVAIRIYSYGCETISDTLLNRENKTYYIKTLNKELEEIVVTAQYTAGSPDKAVHKIRIIDSKTIEQRGATNLKDLFQQEMNIRISQDNILGTGMTIGGVSGENIKILIDGVPMTGRLGGNIDLSQINLSNVERIEIVEGPLSVNYGTNALGGVINIIMKKTQYERLDYGVNTYYESTGQYNADANIGYKFGKNLISLTGQRNYFDGWSQNDKFFKFPKEHLADSSRYNEWKPKEQYMGGVHYHRNMKTFQLHLVSNFFDEKVTNKGLPRAPYNETAFDDYYHTLRFSNTANLSGMIGKDKKVNIMVAYNDYHRTKNTFFKDLTTLEESMSLNAGDQDTSRFELISSRGSFSTTKDSTKINYEIGYDFNIDNGYGQRVKNKFQQIGDYALYASAEYTPLRKISDTKFQLLTIRPGLRYAYNTAYNAPLVPSINVLYKPKERIALRASYAKGFRAPSIKELYFEFIDINHNILGNPDLKAETSDNFQLSGSYSLNAGRKFFRIEPSFYYNDIKNLITLSYIAPPNLNSYVNIGRYLSKGMSLNTSFGEQELMFTLGGNIYWLHSETENEDGMSTMHGYTPEGLASAKYQFIKTKTNVALYYKYTGKMMMYHFDENGDVQINWMGDYHTMDVTVSQPLFKRQVVLAFGVKNLLNVKYIGLSGNSHASHTGSHSAHSTTMPVNWGRSFFVNIKVNLNHRIKK